MLTNEEKSKLIRFEVRKTVYVSEPVYPDDPDYDSITELYENVDEVSINQP